MIDIAIIGGGAAGFFSAINIKERKSHLNVVIFEKSKTLLGKVKISGGGRCNVTHACFNPNQLVAYYPRGHKELLSVFQKFNPTHTIEWFKQRKIELKTEADGRMFPITDDSSTIVNCFLNECDRLKIKVEVGAPLQAIIPLKNGFELLINDQKIQCKKLIITTGSSEFIWQQLAQLGHHIISPVPSLFTFNIKHPLISDLMGVSLPQASLKLLVEKTLLKQFKLHNSEITQTGPMLITHWGLSGPAILKLSSIGAFLLHHLDYQFQIAVNFCAPNTTEQVLQQLIAQKQLTPKKQIASVPLFNMSARLWQRFIDMAFLSQIIWADSSHKNLEKLANALTNTTMPVTGKSTYKDEFVTAGGVDLKAIDFKTMQSKLLPNLYFAGEVLNIDALTGGFNFQAAWSEGWLIGEGI